MSQLARPSFRVIFAVTIPVVSALAACGGGSGDQRSAAAGKGELSCVSQDTTAVGLAVYEFITTQRPTPQRFLSAAGTDSGVPEDGFKILQGKGPTYFYTSDPKGQAQVREKLDLAGPYTSLLVVYRGKTETDNGRSVAVTLGGHYIGGEHEGKVADTRTITVQCEGTRWKVAPASAAPASASADP